MKIIPVSNNVKNLKRLRKLASPHSTSFSSYISINSTPEQMQVESELLDNVRLNPFLNYNSSESEEREVLSKQSQQILEQLTFLKMGLVNNELNESHIHKIKDILDQQKTIFHNKQVQALYQEIRLRAEVELAKLEKLKNK